ncbi:MAG: hypothetical protein IJ243_02575, partial [Prevotella sp.]|nr:hypothetical protein [Prevotella sp.]
GRIPSEAFYFVLIELCNDMAVDLFVPCSPCSQQGSQRALPLIFPSAAIIGSGRCQYRPRPLPTEKAWPFSRSGMAWSPFVATFFLSSLLLWGNERAFELPGFSLWAII